MSQEIFTPNERAAVVSLAIEMCNVDNAVAYEEMLQLNHACSQLGVSPADFELGRRLKGEYAMQVVAHMTRDKKIAVARLLVSVIDADQQVERSELDLLNYIGQVTGISEIFDNPGNQ